MSEWQSSVQLFHKDVWFVSSTRDVVFCVGMDKSMESYLVAASAVSGTVGWWRRGAAGQGI
jgi:hypothetical protein